MFKPSLFNVALLVASLSSHGVDAFWRMNCGLMETGRIDPIVTPGKISSHVHKLAGGYSKCCPSPSSPTRTCPCYRPLYKPL